MARKHKNRNLAKAAQARYDAAGQGRRFAGWNTPSSGPNTATYGLQKIRDRTRDVIRNEWSGAANVRVWTTNIVGTGIVPRFPAAIKQKATKLWNKWVRVADADQILDFYGLQALVVRTWFSGGEAFVRERPRRMSDGLPVPFQVQILEAEMCPLLDTDAYSGLPAGNKIRQGIEFDQIGRRVAYWFYKSHPGDRALNVSDATLLTRVPAEFVHHVFDPQRPGQIRGVSEMACVIAKLKTTADFDDNVSERQRLANLFTLFVTKQALSGDSDPMTGLPHQGSLDEPLAGMEPGMSVELLPGEDVKFSEPPDAGAAYPDYMRTNMMGVAAGSGVPYELMAGDVKDVSDRTLRITINEFRRVCEQRQWLLFIPQMCQPVVESWARYSVLAGELAEHEVEDASSPKWSPQGWAYIHPTQDVQARALEVANGFKARSDVISERGDDAEEVDISRAADKEREDRLGLTPVVITPAPDPAQVKQQADKAKQQNKQAQMELDFYNRVVSVLEQHD